MESEISVSYYQFKNNSGKICMYSAAYDTCRDQYGADSIENSITIIKPISHMVQLLDKIKENIEFWKKTGKIININLPKSKDNFLIAYITSIGSIVNVSIDSSNIKEEKTKNLIIDKIRSELAKNISIEELKVTPGYIREAYKIISSDEDNKQFNLIYKAKEFFSKNKGLYEEICSYHKKNWFIPSLFFNDNSTKDLIETICNINFFRYSLNNEDIFEYSCPICEKKFCGEWGHCECNNNRIITKVLSGKYIKVNAQEINEVNEKIKSHIDNGDDPFNILEQIDNNLLKEIAKKNISAYSNVNEKNIKYEPTVPKKQPQTIVIHPQFEIEKRDENTVDNLNYYSHKLDDYNEFDDSTKTYHESKKEYIDKRIREINKSLSNELAELSDKLFEADSDKYNEIIAKINSSVTLYCANKMFKNLYDTELAAEIEAAKNGSRCQSLKLQIDKLSDKVNSGYFIDYYDDYNNLKQKIDNSPLSDKNELEKLGYFEKIQPIEEIYLFVNKYTEIGIFNWSNTRLTEINNRIIKYSNIVTGPNGKLIKISGIDKSVQEKYRENIENVLINYENQLNDINYDDNFQTTEIENDLRVRGPVFNYIQNNPKFKQIYEKIRRSIKGTQDEEIEICKEYIDSLPSDKNIDYTDTFKKMYHLNRHIKNLEPGYICKLNESGFIKKQMEKEKIIINSIRKDVMNFQRSKNLFTNYDLIDREYNKNKIICKLVDLLKNETRNSIVNDEPNFFNSLILNTLFIENIKYQTDIKYYRERVEYITNDTADLNEAYKLRDKIDQLPRDEYIVLVKNGLIQLIYSTVSKIELLQLYKNNKKLTDSVEELIQTQTINDRTVESYDNLMCALSQIPSAERFALSLDDKISHIDNSIEKYRENKKLYEIDQEISKITVNTESDLEKLENLSDIVDDFNFKFISKDRVDNIKRKIIKIKSGRGKYEIFYERYKSLSEQYDNGGYIASVQLVDDYYNTDLLTRQKIDKSSIHLNDLIINLPNTILAGIKRKKLEPYNNEITEILSTFDNSKLPRIRELITIISQIENINQEDTLLIELKEKEQIYAKTEKWSKCVGRFINDPDEVSLANIREIESLYKEYQSLIHSQYEEDQYTQLKTLLDSLFEKEKETLIEFTTLFNKGIDNSILYKIDAVESRYMKIRPILSNKAISEMEIFEKQIKSLKEEESKMILAPIMSSIDRLDNSDDINEICRIENMLSNLGSSLVQYVEDNGYLFKFDRIKSRVYRNNANELKDKLSTLKEETEDYNRIKNELNKIPIMYR